MLKRDQKAAILQLIVIALIGVFFCAKFIGSKKQERQISSTPVSVATSSE